MRSNLYDVLPDEKHVRKTLSVWSQFSGDVEHDKKFAELESQST